MKKLAAMALLDTTVLSQNLRGFLGDHYGSFSASLDWQKSANSCLSKIKDNMPLFHAPSIEHSSESPAAMWLEAKSFQRDPSIGGVRIVMSDMGSIN